MEHKDSSYYPASLETGGFLCTAETSSEHTTKNMSVNEVTLVALVGDFHFSLNPPYTGSGAWTVVCYYPACAHAQQGVK